MLRDSIFCFSDLDSASPNYKISPLLTQEQKKKFKSVFQCAIIQFSYVLIY